MVANHIFINIRKSKMKRSFCAPPISISILFGLMSDMTEGNVALSSIDNHTRRKTTSMGYEAGIGKCAIVCVRVAFIAHAEGEGGREGGRGVYVPPSFPRHVNVTSTSR